MVSTVGLSNTAQHMTWEEAQRLKLWVANKIGESLDANLLHTRSAETVKLIKERFALLCQHARIHLAEDQSARLCEEVLDELLGFGPIEPLLNDDSITEVMVLSLIHI